MSKTIILLSFLIILKCANAQTPIGVKHDLNGMPFNGYFDPILYSPDKKITEVHNSDSYEIGYYFDEKGKKISGMIKFQDNKIWFKKGEKEFRNTIKPEEVKSFVIGVDSFFTVSKYYYKNTLKMKPVYVQYVSSFGDYTIAKHYHFREQRFGNQSPIVETYLIKPYNSDVWENFPDNKSFKEKALKYFSHIPYLKAKISSEEYESDDMLSVIKMAEYLDKYNNAQAIFYDEYWQEVRNSEMYTYKALITNKKDSTWTFEYFKGNTKLYQGNYSSFYPNVKNGNFTAYYPNGKIRQVVFFDNNNPKEVKVYGKNGSLLSEYQIIRDLKSETIDVKYQVVNNASGENIIKSSESSLTVDDEFSGNTFTYSYNNGELQSLYRKFNKNEVYNIADTNYDFDIKSLQKKFTSFMTKQNYNKALSHNAQGIVLVSVLIDTKGNILESEVLNKIHPELDDIMNVFVKNQLKPGGYKFKPYKQGKEKKYCEVVIPFEFSINRFYRKPVNYYYFNHWQLQNQMMQQQMMNNYIRNMPGGF